MIRILLILIFLFVVNCKLNRVENNHGVPFLDKKQKELVINTTNKNDIIKILGPPSTRSQFNNDLWIYIERKKVKKSIFKLGKEKYVSNNVLALKIDNKGILIDKKIYKLNDMDENYNFTENVTTISYKNNSFIYNLLTSIKQRINAPTERSAK